MQLSLILQLLVLLTVANGIPVMAKNILGDRFAIPIDGGAIFVDGRPILGSSKTVRGIFLSILMTPVFGPVLGLDWRIASARGQHGYGRRFVFQLPEAPHESPHGR